MNNQPGNSDNDARFRIVVVGHVDHGKSTLIGRLLFDLGSIPEGKREQIERACAAEGMPFEYAFLMDALLEEQEQNVTIDTTRLPFRTPRRGYEIIDAPGHAEFLKNMVTGASSASAALLVIDAREGIQEQSRCHAVLLGLLGVKQVAVLVNKMDLCDYAEARFRALEADYRRFLRGIGLEPEAFVPISAREGANLLERSARLPWWRGPTVVEVLDGFKEAGPAPDQPLRFFVQDVYRQGDARIIVGRVETGRLGVGDRLAISPGGRTAIVKTLERWPAPGPGQAGAGESIGLTLAEPLFIERGATLSHEANAPCEGRQLKARIFWLSPQPVAVGEACRLRLGTQEVVAEITGVDRVVDAGSLDEVRRGGPGEVRRHEVADVTLQTRQPVAFDEYGKLPVSGRFVLSRDDQPVGGGIVLPGAYFQRLAGSPAPVANLFWSTGKVSPADRFRLHGHSGCVVWFTGLSGAGKSTLAVELERQLFAAGRHTYLLDGDNLRHGLCAGLGFTPADRSENIRRAAEAAKLLADAGLICLAAFISPLRADRERARQIMPRGRFIEVYVATPVEVCRQRDPKGLYARADRGEIKEFTGVSAPYEPPLDPEITVRTDQESLADSLTRLMELLQGLKDLPDSAPGFQP